ncbi:uncharacterized protein PAC_06310 [Phialocephala subalpina]|uniref:Uncharacterized protein n=1 Tax=Phialocephala subalpina TaxID=576137 RepID=A0A1L7WUG2_9HELO|nr:uncharacterized protein PAC_06310 [Phialocephala subalpina]
MDERKTNESKPKWWSWKAKRKQKKKGQGSLVAGAETSNEPSLNLPPGHQDAAKLTPTSSTAQHTTSVSENHTTVEVAPIESPTPQSDSHEPAPTPAPAPASDPLHTSTNNEQLLVTNTTVAPSGASENAPTEVANQPKPIRELWNEAYEALKVIDDSLMKQYETIMKDEMASVGSLAANVSDPNGVFGHEQMQDFLKKNLIEVDDKKWTLKWVGARDVKVEDLAKPVVGIIKWAKEYIDPVANGNPYTAVAWTGVSLLLPLFLNPSEQAASMVKVMEDISNLIVRCSMREDLYTRRLESTNSFDWKGYRDTLQELYTRILKFQAKSICYLTENGFFRKGRDLIKWDDWDSMHETVMKQEDIFQAVYEIWKDGIYLRESEALVERHKEIMDVNNNISSNVSGLKKAIEDIQRDTERRSLLDFLTTTDPSKNLNAALDKPKAQTGIWLVKDSEDFKNWKDGENSLIWLNGKAGAGKSVLSSTVVKHLEGRCVEDPYSAVAYYYYSFQGTELEQSVEEMLCSLIKQLCCRRPDTPTPLEAIRIKFMEAGHRPDRKTLENTLSATFHGFSNVFLVIDGLDECPTKNNIQKTLLETICRIHKEGHKNLHLLCTSRRTLAIEDMIQPLLSSVPNFDLNLSSSQGPQGDAVEHDIRLHIDKTFEDDTDYQRWSPELKTLAREKLIEKSQGMFQYVTSQFVILSKLHQPKKIRQALEDLPEGLDETYERILTDIDPQYQKQVLSMLKWLAFSLRPLTLQELAEIFILDCNLDPPFDSDNRLNSPIEVLAYLPGLVEKSLVPVDRRRGGLTQITLAHFSIKEYLVSKRIIDGRAKEFSIAEMDSHLHIADSCLAYHLHLSQSLLVTGEQSANFPLWEYVAKHWFRHLDKVKFKLWPPPLAGRISQALSPKSQSLLNLVWIADPHNRAYINNVKWGERSWDELYTPLYYAAILNAFEVVQFLLEKGCDIEERSPGPKDHQSALYGAAYFGRQNMVRALLDAGADINAKSGRYGDALHVAVFMGDRDIVYLLLDRGADINAECGIFGTPLETAVVRSEMEIALLLLCVGAKENIRGMDRKGLKEQGKYWTLSELKDFEWHLERMVATKTRDLHEGLQTKWKERPQGEAIVAKLQEFMRLVGTSS